MEKDELFDIWNTGNENFLSNKKIDPSQVEKILNKKMYKTFMPIYFNLVFFFLFQLANVILSSANLPGYQNNKPIFLSLLAMLVLSIGFMLYGIFLFYKFREMNKYTDSLINQINKQLNYFKTPYEFWLIIIALSSLMLIYNLGFMVDYNEGYFPINHKGLFIIVSIFVFLFIYGSQKFTTIFYIRNLKANLHDLKYGILDQTLKIEKRRKKHIWVWVVIFVILTLIFIAGILKSNNLI